MKTTIGNLDTLLDRLRAAKIHDRVRDDREGAVSIDVVIPDQRWEIDMLADGTVEIEVFTRNGMIHDAGKLQELFSQFGTPHNNLEG